MLTLILFFLFSIVFSFLCSIWEAVLLSIVPSYVQTEIQKKSSIGAKLQVFKEDIDKPLSAILTLNTIAHTIGAIGVGAQAAKLFGNNLGFQLGPIHVSWASIVGALMTLAILILSEIIPKTIGANNWRSLTPFTVRSLSFLLKILYPFVWLSSLITKKMKSEKNKSVLSRADFLAQLNAGTTSGAIAKDESMIISNLLKLDKILVEDIMTPRVVAEIVSEDVTIEQYYRSKKELQFSRIPVFKNSPDNISGMILKDDLYNEMILGNGQGSLASIRRSVQIISESKTLRELMSLLVKTGEHIAIVEDNYGSITGIVTLEDLFETILGMEIVDESDGTIDMQILAENLRSKKHKNLSSKK